MYKRILVPLDGSEQAESLLPHVRALAEDTWAELILMRVLAQQPSEPLFRRPSPGLGSENGDAVRLLTQGYLEQLAEPLRARHLKVTTEVCHGDAAETIVRCAEGWEIDLIVLSTSRSGGSTSWLMDDTVQRVTQQARVPVLLIGRAARAPRAASLSEGARLPRS